MSTSLIFYVWLQAGSRRQLRGHVLPTHQILLGLQGLQLLLNKGVGILSRALLRYMEIKEMPWTACTQRPEAAGWRGYVKMSERAVSIWLKLELCSPGASSVCGGGLGLSKRGPWGRKEVMTLRSQWEDMMTDANVNQAPASSSSF